MPRPKGSKNKKIVVENLDAQIAEAQKAVEELGASLKAKKAELKNLLTQKARAEKAAAAKKAEEDKAKVLDALKKSGKSVEELLDFLK